MGERQESKRSVKSTISHPNETRREIETHGLQKMEERQESNRSVQSTISHPNERAHNEQDEKSKLTCCKGRGNDEKANVPSSQQSRVQTNVHTTNETRNRNSPAAKDGGTTSKRSVQ